MTQFCHTFHTSITCINHRRGHAGMSKNRLGPRTGREPRQETRLPLLRSMVGSTEAEAKGRGSPFGVIAKVSGVGCRPRAEMRIPPLRRRSGGSGRNDKRTRAQLPETPITAKNEGGHRFTRRNADWNWQSVFATDTRRVARGGTTQIRCEMASIRTKAVSRTEFSCPVFVTPRVDQSSVEDQELRTSRLNHLRWRQPLHHPSMRP